MKAEVWQVIVIAAMGIMIVSAILVIMAHSCAISVTDKLVIWTGLVVVNIGEIGLIILAFFPEKFK